MNLLVIKKYGRMKKLLVFGIIALLAGAFNPCEAQGGVFKGVRSGLKSVRSVRIKTSFKNPRVTPTGRSFRRTPAFGSSTKNIICGKLFEAALNDCIYSRTNRWKTLPRVEFQKSLRFCPKPATNTNDETTNP